MGCSKTSAINAAAGENAIGLPVSMRALHCICYAVLSVFAGCGKVVAPADSLWEECSAYLVKNGVDVEADDYAWCADMCRVVRRYTHDKLTVAEIMVAMDQIEEFMAGDGTARDLFMVSKEDRVRASIRLLEMMEETKGKLVYEEKEAMVACAIWVCTARQTEKESAQTAFAAFKDFAEFDRLYREMKEGKYSPMFLRHDPGSEGRFGYDITNPIRALSVRDSYRYLNRLRPRRDSVKFEQDRVCSMSGRNNNIIDKWVFFCEDSASHTNFTFTIYVDPYCEKTSKEAFDGWMLLEE